MLPIAPSVAGLDAATSVCQRNRIRHCIGGTPTRQSRLSTAAPLVADARGKGLAAIRTSTVAIDALEWAHEVPALSDVLLHMDASISGERTQEAFGDGTDSRSRPRQVALLLGWPSPASTRAIRAGSGTGHAAVAASVNGFSVWVTAS